MASSVCTDRSWSGSVNYFILLAPEKVKEWGRGEDKRMYSDITI